MMCKLDNSLENLYMDSHCRPEEKIYFKCIKYMWKLKHSFKNKVLWSIYLAGVASDFLDRTHIIIWCVIPFIRILNNKEMKIDLFKKYIFSSKKATHRVGEVIYYI